MLVLAQRIDPEVAGFQTEPTIPVGLAFGCTYPDTFADSELWRLMAANYIHWSPLHLVMNGFALFILGNLAAQTFGGTRTWVIYVASGLYDRVLVCGTETHSVGLDMTTRGRDVSVIFGDGAGAVVLEPSDDAERGILSVHLHAEGKYAKKLWAEVDALLERAKEASK